MSEQLNTSNGQLVLNGFTTPKDIKPPPELSLLTSTFQNLIPPLSAQTTSVSSIRRVLLFNRTQIPGADGASIDIIDLRHFSISTKPVGLPRTVRKTASSTPALPNLGKFEDVADFVLNGNDYDSASEIDEDEKVEVPAPSVKPETSGTQQRAIRLTEIGPRLRLELVKIEEGMCDGKVLYHRYVQKTKVHKL
jgi:ribosome biogenesis protein SSF1/2